MIGVVATREIRALYRSPLAWAVLAFAQFVVAYQFLVQIELFAEYGPRLRRMPVPPGVTELVVQPTFATAAMLVLFVVPVLSMHSLSLERRAGTLKLWYSAPISLSVLVGGKFAGLLSLLAVVLAMTALMPLTLLWGATLDLGVYASGVLALALLAMAAAAIGLFFSSLTAQPAVAAFASFATLLLLWMMDWGGAGHAERGVVSYLAMAGHYQRLARGLVGTGDVAYFLLLTITALALTRWRLGADRRAF